MAKSHLSTQSTLHPCGAKCASLVRLAVSADPCSEAVGDVLDTLARQAVIPWSIDLRRTAHGLSLAIEVENFAGVAKLAARVEVLARVREVCVVERFTRRELDHG